MNAPTVPTNNEDRESLVDQLRNIECYHGGELRDWMRNAVKEAADALAARPLPVSGDNAELIAWNRSMAEWEREHGGNENAAQHDACAAALSAPQPREAAPSDTDLAERLERVIFAAPSRIEWQRQDSRIIAEAIVSKLPALGLSRTSHPVQVEPTVEEWNAAVAAERASHPDRGYTAEHDRAHGLRHLANWAIDYARRGKGVKSSSMILALLDAAEPVQVEITADDMVQKVARVIERETDEPGWSAVVIARNVLAALGGGDQ